MQPEKVSTDRAQDADGRSALRQHAVGESLDGTNVAVAECEHEVIDREGSVVANARERIGKLDRPGRLGWTHVGHKLFEFATGYPSIAAEGAAQIVARLIGEAQACPPQFLTDEAGGVTRLVTIAGEGGGNVGSLEQLAKRRASAQLVG